MFCSGSGKIPLKFENVKKTIVKCPKCKGFFGVTDGKIADHDADRPTEEE